MTSLQKLLESWKATLNDYNREIVQARVDLAVLDAKARTLKLAIEDIEDNIDDDK